MKVFNSDEEKAKRDFQKKKPSSRKTIIMVYRILACLCLVYAVAITLALILYCCGVIKSTNDNVVYALSFALFFVIFIGSVCLGVSISFNKWHKEQEIKENSTFRERDVTYLEILKKNNSKNVKPVAIQSDNKQQDEKKDSNICELLQQMSKDYNEIISNNEICVYVERFIKRENYIDNIEILSAPIKDTRTGNLKLIFKETDLIEGTNESIDFTLKTALNSTKNKIFLEDIHNALARHCTYDKKNYINMLYVLEQQSEFYELIKKSDYIMQTYKDAQAQYTKVYEKYKNLFFFKRSLIEQGLLKEENAMALGLVISEMQNKILRQRYEQKNKEFGFLGSEDKSVVLNKLFELNLGQKEVEEYLSLKFYQGNLFTTYNVAIDTAEKLVKDYLYKAKTKRYLDSLLSDNQGQKKTIEDVDLMSGMEFENFVAELFSKMGHKTEVTKASGDQGIDIIATKGSVKLAIQAKCYSGVVGNHAIMEAVAGMKYYDATKCMVVTNNFFTKSARELAESNGVELWDRSVLIEKIEEV